ncbi:chloride channel protein [Bosea lathyri]|nr:chloride channel protein [Bosea lathyri]
MSAFARQGSFFATLRVEAWARLQRFRKKLSARGSEIRLIGVAALVGIAAGVAVSAMSWISKAMHSLIFGIPVLDWLSAAPLLDRLIVLSAPIVGGMVLGCLILLQARRNMRPIIDPIEANALYGGRMSLTSSVVVAVQNLISNGFGASVGLEAGYTQLSAGIASKLGATLKLRREDLRILVGCGAAGAIAAAFNAPLTGAFYAFELIIGSYSTVVLAPVVVAALLATLIARLLPTGSLLIEAGHMPAIMPGDFVPAIALGVVCALVGIAIMMMVSAVEELARKSAVPPYLRPLLGGVAVGLLALQTPQVLSAGHGALHLNLEGNIATGLLIQIFLLKAIASAVSIGSGFRGGLFFASLFMGALLGKIFAMVVGAMSLGGLTPASLAIVGMSALAVSIIGGPLTMTFLALEMTGNLTVAALVLAAAITSAVVVRTTFGYSFATWRFHLRGESIRSAHDVGWIRNLTVDKLMRADVRTIGSDISLDQLKEKCPIGSTQCVIVVDADGRYQGIVHISDIHTAAPREPGASILDFLKHKNDILQPTMNAKQAAEIFDRSQSEALAVVSDMIGRRVVGQLSESHTLRRYSEELDRRRREIVGEAV